MYSTYSTLIAAMNTTPWQIRRVCPRLGGAPTMSSARWTGAERSSVWPRPHTAKLGTSSLVISPDAPLFEHKNPLHSEGLVGAAFDRAAHIIFSNYTLLPHLRVRVHGVRVSTSPPEQEYCGMAIDNPVRLFGTLTLTIDAATSTPLQFGVDESYSLELSSTPGGGGTLRAATEWGALRGIETFVQLVQHVNDGEGILRSAVCGLPLSIFDRPSFRWRGLLLDTSRHFLPVRTSLLPMLDAMAAVKLNTLHWHMTDAHSFPVHFDAEPRLATQGALHHTLVYTSSELRAVVAAAERRGVRIVPELDMPAHTASWAFGRPDLVVTCPKRVASDNEGLEHGANKAALHPLRRETYELIGRLLAEMAAIFPDEYVHLGGDEVDGECWLSDPDIAQWAAEHRRSSPWLDWKHALIALFAKRVVRMASRLGKKVILWDDALEAVRLLPSISTTLPGSDDAGGDDDDDDRYTLESTVTIDVWRDWVRTQHERREQALLAGHQVVWSALGWYQDLPGNTWDAMYHNVQLPRPTDGLLGGETSCWNEHADATNLQERVLLRAAAVAERLWSGPPSDADVARQRLASLRCRLVRRGFRAPPVIPDHCEFIEPAPRPSEREPPLTCGDVTSSSSPLSGAPTLPGAPPSLPAASHVDGGLLSLSLALNAVLLVAFACLAMRRGRRGLGAAGKMNETDVQHGEARRSKQE